MIEVIDKRQAPNPRGIPWSEATPGRLYQTIGGQKESVVMAIRIPAIDYRKAFPNNDGLAFLNAEGAAYPCTTDRLIPLAGSIEWFITGEDA